jgi:hypothetical protein
MKKKSQSRIPPAPMTSEEVDQAKRFLSGVNTIMKKHVPAKPSRLVASRNAIAGESYAWRVHDREYEVVIVKKPETVSADDRGRVVLL